MSKSIRRFLAIAVALVLALILAGIADFTVSYADDPGQDVSGGNSSATDATLAFDGSPSRNGNVVSVTVGTNKTVTITVSGTNSYSGFEWNDTTLKYHSSRKGDIQFALGGDFNASTMSVSLIGPNNYRQAFASSATVSMSPNWNLPDGVQFSISETSGQGGGSDPSGGGGNNGGGNNISLTLNVTGDSNLVYISVSIPNDDRSWGFPEENSWTRSINANTSGSGTASTYNVKIEAAVGYKIDSATLGGANPTRTQIDKAFFDGVTVTPSEGAATISIYVTASVDTGYTNILWTYDGAEANGEWADAYINPSTGTIEIEKITRGSSVLFEYNSSSFPLSRHEWSPGRYDNRYTSPDGTIGVSIALTPDNEIENWYVTCRKDDVIIFKFIPAPGYQLASASLNGHVLDPQDDPCTYEVVMQGFLHLSGVFAETSVQTKVASSQNVSGLSVSGANDSIQTGNVAASVTGGRSNPTESALEAAMTDAADFHEAVETVDISMTNIISKGGSGTYFNNASNYWTNVMSNLSAPVTVSLDVPNNLAEGETYSIVRNHNGTLQELNAVYNATTGKLTFESDKFSEYTIIKRAGTPVTGSSSGSDSSSESSSDSDSSSESSSGSDSSSDSSSGDETAADPEGTVTIPTEVIGETTLPAEEVKALGVTFAPVVTAPTETIYSVYNPYTGEIVYTPDAAEKNALVSSGWTDQGILWDTSKDPTVAAPVYRLYNPVTGEHFYTINQSEVIACAKMGFSFEGSAFHVPLKGKLIPVYRMFCSKVAAGAHRFVEDETEVARLEATGNWVKEGIAWYTIAK